MKKNSLKTKLTLLLVFMSIIPVLTGLGFTYVQTVQQMTALVEDEVKDTVSVIDYFLDEKAGEALTLAKKYAQRPEMKAGFLEGDKEKTDAILRPLFAALSEDIGLSVLELGSSEGDVFARAHNPEKFGDNKSDNLSVAAALNGESVSGVEMGSSGLAIRAVVPIKDNDRIIGTFQVGFDDSVLTDIQHAINGDISLYTKDVLAQTSNENRQSDVGTALGDASIYQRVTNGEVVEVENGNQMNIYQPLYDTLGENVIGMVEFTHDVSTINTFKRAILGRTAFILLAVLILSAVVSALLSRSFSKPVDRILALIQKTADFDLTDDASYQDLTVKKDEMRAIAESVLVMREKLTDLVWQMRAASEELVDHSSRLSVSANESSDSNQQMVLAVNEIASGSGEMAETLTEAHETIKAMARNVAHASEGMETTTHSAAQSLEVVAQGQKAVEGSERTTRKIVDTFAELKQSINELSGLIGNVSTITDVIDSISSQTNLLALNASIEAAQAGEAGKGFAVVAEEVRLLAEKSTSSAKEIAGIIQVTGEKSRTAVEKIQGTEEAVAAQEEAVSITKDSFRDIQSTMEQIAEQTTATSELLTQIDGAAQSIADKMQDISAAGEQSAANAQEIYASSEEQQALTEVIASFASGTSDTAEKLKAEIAQFTIQEEKERASSLVMEEEVAYQTH